MQEKYTFYCGTVRGCILEFDVGGNVKHAKPETASEVTALCPGKSEKELLVGFDNGQVQRYNIPTASYQDTLSKLEGEGKIVGLAHIEGLTIAAKHDGVINLKRKKIRNHIDLKLDDKATLESIAYNYSNENVIGTGGEHNDFKLWDIETHQCIFKAKSLGHDKLNLPIPTTVRGITFFPQEPSLSACCTKEGHVLLYDNRVQRRPVVKFLEPKASYTTISCAFRERQCLAGTTRGYLQLLDMKSGKCVKTFSSYTGSISSVECDPLEPYVFTSSLDKFFRVHNLDTKELIHKVYLKQGVTKLLSKPIIKDESDAEDGSKNKCDEEYDHIFESMEVIEEESRKRKAGTVKKSKKIKM